MLPVLSDLLALQHPSGAFPCTVRHGEVEGVDLNGFVTAQVLREIESLAASPSLADLCRRALDYVAECESSERPGHFAFWPRRGWPLWAPLIPEDADCSAVIASELLHYGRISRGAARRIAIDALLPYRDASGAFFT